eukprot:5775542-Amphidinium_carterae.1
MEPKCRCSMRYASALADQSSHSASKHAGCVCHSSVHGSGQSGNGPICPSCSGNRFFPCCRHTRSFG